MRSAQPDVLYYDVQTPVFLAHKPNIGIGLPGVAASGTIAANTIVDPSAQLMLIGEMKRMQALQ